MAHLTAKSAYVRLSDRLNRFPQGAPPSELLYKILRLLFSEKEEVSKPVNPSFGLIPGSLPGRQD